MTTRKFILHGDGVPRLSSPVSHAVVVNGTCYISGQLSVSASGEYVPGTVREEAERAFANFFSVVRAANYSEKDVVFIDIAFSDLADAREVNTLCSELFEEGCRPARTIYQAAALPFGGKIKVTGIAVA